MPPPRLAALRMPANSSGCRGRRCSRQVSALEQELAVSLFHRHARGLILTEQGDLLFRTAHDVFMQLQAARAKLTDSRERPQRRSQGHHHPGRRHQLADPRLGEFTALYPDIRISLIVTDEELDLSMREANVAIRLRKPTQPDLIQRKLFSMGFPAYCSPEYLKRHGTPRTLDELDSSSHHRARRLDRAVAFAEPELAGRGQPQRFGPARRRASRSTTSSAWCAPVSSGLGIACLPDYLVEENNRLVQLFGDADLDSIRYVFCLSRRIEDRWRACRSSATLS